MFARHDSWILEDRTSHAGDHDAQSSVLLLHGGKVQKMCSSSEVPRSHHFRFAALPIQLLHFVSTYDTQHSTF